MDELDKILSDLSETISPESIQNVNDEFDNHDSFGANYYRSELYKWSTNSARDSYSVERFYDDGGILPEEVTRKEYVIYRFWKKNDRFLKDVFHVYNSLKTSQYEHFHYRFNTKIDDIIKSSKEKLKKDDHFIIDQIKSLKKECNKKCTPFAKNNINEPPNAQPGKKVMWIGNLNTLAAFLWQLRNGHPKLGIRLIKGDTASYDLRKLIVNNFLDKHGKEIKMNSLNKYFDTKSIEAGDVSPQTDVLDWNEIEIKISKRKYAKRRANGS